MGFMISGLLDLLSGGVYWVIENTKKKEEKEQVLKLGWWRGGFRFTATLKPRAPSPDPNHK